MRTLIASEMLCVDRCFSGPHGELYSCVQYDYMSAYVERLIESVDTILYGRAYRMMAAYWPEASGSFADRTNRLPKLVFSSTLDQTPWGDWDNAGPLKGELVDEVARLKNEPGGDMVIFGSFRERSPSPSSVWTSPSMSGPFFALSPRSLQTGHSLLLNGCRSARSRMIATFAICRPASCRYSEGRLPASCRLALAASPA